MVAKNRQATSDEVAWWTGVPTTLLAKRTLVTATSGIPEFGSDDDGARRSHDDAERRPSERLAVRTLTFAVPDDPEGTLRRGKAMPHAHVNVGLGDVVKMVIPGHKPKSYSVSALRLRDSPPQFDVTVKVYPHGRASGYLDRMVVGDTIHSFAKSAHRVRNPGSFVGIIAFGVGITEALPVARAELKHTEHHAVRDSCDKSHPTNDNGNDDDSNTTVTLLWANRTRADTFWNDDIRQLTETYAGRFRVHYIFSREDANHDSCDDNSDHDDYRKDDFSSVWHGRITASVLKRVFQPADPSRARFLAVGTKEMMRYTYEDLLVGQLGYRLPLNALLPKREKPEKQEKQEGYSDAKRKRLA